MEVSMNNAMKALVAYGSGDYRYEDVSKPEPKSGEIILKVKGCGVCAGDLKAYYGKGMIAPKESSKEDRFWETPVIPGHEFFGEIVDLAEDVEGFERGDYVVAEQIVPCGTCPDCLGGVFWMCGALRVFGLKQYVQGGFAEYIKLPKNSRVHKIPDTFTIEQAVLIEPYACGMHAAERARITHNDVVVISGLGPIGLAITNIVRLSLPKLIIGVDINENRLKLGKEFGADVVLNPNTCDLGREIAKINNGIGCDKYIEASGYGESVVQGLNILRNHGTYVQFGALSSEVLTNWNTIGDGKELTIYGSHLSARCFPAVIKGIKSGLLRTDGLVSHVFPLKDWKRGFETAKTDSNAMKVALVP
jgi:threonine dehydrogenase-like Zn-dependent dehydrogenase